MTNHVSRRSFLKSAAGTTALILSISSTPSVLATDTDNSGNVTPCLRFTEDGQIFVCVPIPDMGQGMITTAAQIIAEELDLDPNQTGIEMMAFQGHADAEGRASEGPMPQGAGGSLSTMMVWGPLRHTAAYARDLFLHAAAIRWSVPLNHLETRNGAVYNKNTKVSLPYKYLVSDTRRTDYTVLRGNATPKAAKDRTLIGKDQRNVHATAIATGQPIFGIDSDIPDMKHAVIRRCPHLNGSLVSYDRDALLALPGVKHVVEIARRPDDLSRPRILPAGLAIIADSFWRAKKAADMAEIEWDGSRAAGESSAVLKARMAEHLETGEVADSKEGGDLAKAMAEADKVIEATYYHPHWAHACMEPHNCIADVKADSAEIWTSHQSITESINAAAAATDLPISKITSNVMRCGTGLGRKYAPDFVMEACILSKAIGAPVKVTWTREDEMEQDHVNPSAMYRMRAAVDAKGRLTGWHVRTAADGWIRNAAMEPPMGLVDNYRGEWGYIENNVRRGPWRGPQHNTAAWVIQGFLNEVAIAAGKDPLDFLLDLYSRKDFQKLDTWPFPLLEYERFRKILKAVAKDARYGRRMPDGWGQGIAIYHTFSGTCAHVVEIEMIGDTDYRVHKVTSAIDCGLAVNPLGVRAQVEGGINDGLSAAKYGNFRFEDGVPVTNNFDSYQMMRIGEAPPEINVRIMDFGDEDPRGTGEVALPPLIPALTNAIFAASGKRVRTLPISENL
ncbi:MULTISPECIES: xanthine dehydrogenase family protein molybdopterin-binding subunit [Kordiimonas]|uniref:xanthine dehydrogenase family protein molybdopterin-binding subunit n=1 Tax=Kordiimonas TaxID=288021 RepID=UPI00257E317B|nr:molybdopterin cofactor-binding domain-containing protein [Kordiimonas sp. UBA4487]